MEDLSKNNQNLNHQNQEYIPYYKQSLLQYNQTIPINKNLPEVQPFQIQQRNDYPTKVISPTFNMNAQTYINPQANTNYNSLSNKGQNIFNTSNNYISSVKSNEQDNIFNAYFKNKQYENQSNFSSAINQQSNPLKQISTQSIIPNYQQENMNQEINSSDNQSQLIVELKAEIASLKREHQKQLEEKDAQIFKLSLANGQLQDQINKQQTSMTELQNQIQQQKRLEEQNKQRRQRQREEQDIQRQIAYFMQLEEEQLQIHRHQNNLYPDVDNMTYEELLHLEEQMGSVSKGMKQEDINKIKEVVFDKTLMKDFCDMCSVCQSEFDNGETVKELNPCKHVYHPDCINKWLEKEKHCPNCKQPIQV